MNQIYIQEWQIYSPQYKRLYQSLAHMNCKGKLMDFISMNSIELLRQIDKKYLSYLRLLKPHQRQYNILLMIDSSEATESVKASPNIPNFKFWASSVS